jgi:cytochrome c oxidase accessory protein FixG
MTIVIERRAAASPPPRRRAGPEGPPAGNGGLYQKRRQIYPKLAHGRWRLIKWALLAATLGVYYVTPWLRWSRPGGAPQQAVLVDFTGRRFYFFPIQLWPQEIYFITGLLVMAALALFLVSALFGRLWCGYACPQTVWTDLYIALERLFEGDRNARMRRDQQAWSLDKAWRKGGKHLAWLAVAFVTGGAWVFYFHDAPPLWRTFWVGEAPITAYVSVGLLTGTTYLLAGTMREQVCTYMCPWPRIQGAMLDGHSLQVTYRRDRGEPRGAHKKGQAWSGRGDCVDCGQCVAVCPMGIDIRDGGQIECINCGLCIDACNEIMLKVQRPRGLIAYDTDEAVAAREAGGRPTYPLIRARTVYYGVALAIVSALMIGGLATRTPVAVEALRDRNPTFVRLHDGAVRNGYTLKIDNRSFERRQLTVSLSGLPDATIQTPGGAPTRGPLTMALQPNEVLAARVLVRAPPQDLTAQSLPVAFAVTDGKRTWRAASTFLSSDVNLR